MENKQIINETLKEFLGEDLEYYNLSEDDIEILTELLTQALEKGNK